MKIEVEINDEDFESGVRRLLADDNFDEELAEEIMIRELHRAVELYSPNDESDPEEAEHDAEVVKAARLLIREYAIRK